MTTLPDKIGHVRGAPTGLSTTPPPVSAAEWHEANYPKELALPEPTPGYGWDGNDHLTGGECDGWVKPRFPGFRWTAKTAGRFATGYENTRDLAQLRVTRQLWEWECENGYEACGQSED